MDYSFLMAVTALLSFAGMFNFLLAQDARDEGNPAALLHLVIGVSCLTLLFHLHHQYLLGG